jgi:tetratricopeptide (TPR) repeat protein
LWGPKDPRTISAMREVGYLYQLQGKYDKAIKWYDDAILLCRVYKTADGATMFEAMHQRARALNRQGKLDEAIQAAEEVYEARRKANGPKHPDTIGSLHLLSVLVAKKGRFDESKQMIEETIQLLPANEWVSRNSVAWFLATSKYDEIRDGKRALELATQACELTDYKSPTCLDTLAATYAEVGDFASAVKWAERTVELTSDDAQHEKYRIRLQKYQRREPLREP